MKIKALFILAIFAVSLLSVTVANAVTATYIYDELNRLTQVTYDDGTFIKYAYDEIGNRTEMTSRVATPAVMTSPANGSILTGSSQVFTWTNVSADAYQLWVGTAPGTYNHGVFDATSTSVNATNIPTNGRTIYVTLLSKFGTKWESNAYTYTAAGTMSVAAMISPVNGSTLAGASQVFTWTDAGADLYVVHVGTTPGSYDIGAFPAVGTTTTTTTATGLPTIGSTIYVTLWSCFGTTWLNNAYTYTAAGTLAVNVAKIVSTQTLYNTLQGAFTSAVTGDTVLTPNGSLAENIIFSGGKQATIKGGYDSGFANVTGNTTLRGTLTINSGSTLTVNKLTIKLP